MVETLSDAGQVAMGALDPAVEPASLEAIVRGSVDAIGAEGRARIHVSVEPGPHLIGSWDPTLLRRVVTNLIGNAFKYSPPGSLVGVDLGRADAGTARLSVTDEGIGLTEDERSMVFERFVRTDRARAGGSPGLGLGLYACRGIVAAHGGAITIESDGPGRGTVVIVTLPLLEPED
jgi:signal transduction histidine kinase